MSSNPTRREFLEVAAAAVAFAGTSLAAPKDQPNIVFIMLDELGYFELSCMGNKHLKTPNIDRMATEGMRFTQALAGGPVCAPTRSVLMTGQHLGHTTVRSNGGGLALRRDDVTVAEVLKAAGYATGGFGKWGLGDRGTTGVPEQHGFDLFFGYYHQVHAHGFYPNYLLRNSKKISLAGNTGDYHKGETFSHYLIYDETVKFIRENKDRPFFCYCPWTPPHGQWGIPEDEPSWAMYRDKKWDATNQKGAHDAQIYAAMVNMADRQVGEIFKLLKELDIDEKTIVFFCGDNGGQAYFKNEAHPNGFFEPNGGVYRGGKGDLYEGGLRIPMIVRWPGKIEPSSVSDHLWYFPDVMPTLADIASAATPSNTDGISVLPTLLGEEVCGCEQKQHEYLYWEFGEGQAVRMGKWKLVKPSRRPTGLPKGTEPPFELYDLDTDISEQNNLAENHPDILAKLVEYAEQAHTPNIIGETLDPDLGFKGHDKK
jgi:arylsulfatase A